ncbi:MAG: hypothetical protein KKA75_03110 [Proteobacteria bacterium]|nr:hypothetical protein [Pseudomonadota bacterium]
MDNLDKKRYLFGSELIRWFAEHQLGKGCSCPAALAIKKQPHTACKRLTLNYAGVMFVLVVTLDGRK